MKKLERWGTLSPRLPMTAVKNCVGKIFTYSQWYGKWSLPYKIHEWFSMFSYRKTLTKFVQKLKILCNTEVLIFTIFHYTIDCYSTQASKSVAVLLHKFIIKFWNSIVLCKVYCLYKWNETEKFYFISLNTLTAGLRIYRTWISV